MSDNALPHLRLLIAGRLTRSYHILPSGQSQEDVVGGSALYGAVGAALWDAGVGMVARVGCDYPEEWLEKMNRVGIDVRGVRRLSEAVDLRVFTTFTDADAKMSNNPVAAYANLGLPYPKALLGYTHDTVQLDSRTRPGALTIRQSDLPSDYYDATAAHIAPLDFLSHTLLPPTLRGGHVATVTLDAGEGYMDPAFFDDIPVLLNGLSAFLTSENKISKLFLGRSIDPWEMAVTLAEMGCPLIVIKRGSAGQYLYERDSHTRWIIPAYPVQANNLTGAGDAFSGGFLAGLRESYDPLAAVMYGNISASFALEHPDPFYPLAALPGLAKARLASLREKIRRL
jgi:sugar/nucleoside kinase (ribokinase family)